MFQAERELTAESLAVIVVLSSPELLVRELEGKSLGSPVLVSVRLPAGIPLHLPLKEEGGMALLNCKEAFFCLLCPRHF